ncbi:hypothetical protein [Anabaena sp. CS-542/02]|uniref:hypothetical protein n=1 Tax=Anabaena sp. CS-542/02 TaxID=3021719 RepID=UPI00232B627A|nr:hypothetical protein [Anabaena sp. CS-542/02]MDB9445703.1 hypothetical protein [Anabaena sp. CS-542/02]
MANITIQNLEVESTALNQVSPSEMEKVVGGWTNYAGAIQAITTAQVLTDFAGLIGGWVQMFLFTNSTYNGYNPYNGYNGYNPYNGYNA